MKFSKSGIYFCICLAVILWGLSFVWTNQLLNLGVPVFTLVFIRMLVAGVFLIVVGKLSGQIQHIAKGDFKWFLLMATMEPFVYFIGETFGMKLTSSPSLSSVIIASIPIFGLLGGRILAHERISLKSTLGICITLPGLCMVILGQIGFNLLPAQGSGGSNMGAGVALLFLAVLSAVAYSVIVKRIAQTYNAFTVTTYQMSLGAVYFLPFALIFDLPHLNEGFLVTWDFWYPLLMLAIFCSVVSFIFYIKALRILGVTLSSTFNALIPIVTAIFCYFTGVETFNWIQVAGIIIVVAGVILSQWHAPKTAHSRTKRS